jgi:isoleucyl-tRNA synthetase
VVVWSSEELTRGSIRLGMWMDWGNDYFTFSDTNIEYIWRFLRHVHERGWLYQGHRSTEWCPRCGTSISAHELVGHYEDRADPSLYVRFPLCDRPGQSLVVWTTTPWTLPANVAAAVNPEAEYVLSADGEWVARSLYSGSEPVGSARGAELVGLAYDGPFDHLPAAAGVAHRVIPWEDVALDEGTGIVHIAPGCGAEDFELSRLHDLAVIQPVDEAGRFYDTFGWLHGLGTAEAAEQIVQDLAERGKLVSAGEKVHRFPFCWRCHTPLIFRISDDWFISVDELRQPLLEANATVEWTPAYMGKRMDDWLRNMGDWNISRRRYYGLPLPFYPCECGRLNVVGSRAELEERATGGLEGLEELRRPWIDAVRIRCEDCGAEVDRILEVGDVWLDAGIVPFSTLGWQNPEWKPQGYATGAAKGLTTADLPDHGYWETWFPADWVSEMREQIRLWFYSQLFMSVALVGRAPFRRVLGYEKMLDEHGREMHGSWGNMIDAEDAFARMGADVMRWQYCAQPPSQNLLFGFGPAEEIKRKLLTLWNSVKFLADYGRIEGFEPVYTDLATGPEGDVQALDRWLLARTRGFLAEAAAGYEAYLSVNVIRAFERFLDDLSNWYIRRSRRRFYGPDWAAFRTLWVALVQTVRAIGPIMPFLAEHLWQRLVAAACPGAPESVFLAGWPEAAAEPGDAALVAEMEEVRRVCELGRAARDQAGLRLRQPLRALTVEGTAAAARHADEIAGELRVKAVEFRPFEGATVRAKPNLPLVGPRLGKELPAVREALAGGGFELLDGGGVRVLGHELSAAEVFVERTAPDGWAIAEDAGLLVALDVRLDPELELEGRVLDLIHTIQRMRKEAGLEVTDRIVLTLPEEDGVLAHVEWIKSEVLAVEVERGPELAIRKA